MKILIFGLPGAGKTYLSERLQKHFKCAWYNGDEIRKMADDWEFSPEGRLRQASRMRNLANFEKDSGRWVLCDFICPTNHYRNLFDADISIWVDTIREGRFDDTNKMFEFPSMVDYKIEKFLSDEEIKKLANMIINESEEDVII